MGFASFIGNELIVKSLQDSIRGNNLFHAYLLQGPPGSGTGRLAELFAQAILCERGDGDACGACIACHKMEHGNHEDFVLYEKEKNSVKDEVIGQLQERIQKKPYHGSRTVVVIHDAHTLTPRAQARLLKTLEEPTSGVVLILLAEHTNNIADTILSRCIVHGLRPLRRQQITDYLTKVHKLSQAEAELLSAVADGSIGKAEELRSQEGYQEERRNANLLAADLLTRQPFYRIAPRLKTLATGKEQTQELLEHMERWYRDLLLLSLGESTPGLVNVDQKQELLQHTGRYPLEVLMGLIRLIEQGKNDLERNAQPGYVLKNLVIRRLQQA